ncbi:putative cAMP-dependent protein kinase type 1 [Blattamonas nauphoetae]|uniref:non-specific serine/threonine protein kinase n=1 Tax=Blattamonas nauphoetae TaxID=2049346 RepID=A0ABQ9Y9Z3_9EUKA|nr:putative cAMP-dependent protein kinase type 1 [Blattamonas nauphoetae]
MWTYSKRQTALVYVVQKPDGAILSAKIVDSFEVANKEFQTAHLLSSIQIQPDFLILIRECLKNPDSNQSVIFMDYADQGDLAACIQSNQTNGISEDIVKHVMFMVAHGIVELHRNGFVHRDIKPDNLMFQSDPTGIRIKISDYGLLKQVGTSFTDLGIGMTSPEALQEQPYSFSMDVWALGCIMYEMLSGHHPFATSSLKQLYKMVLNPPPPLENKSQHCQDLLKSLLTVDPSRRISSTNGDLLNHPFFSGMTAETALLDHNAFHIMKMGMASDYNIPTPTPAIQQMQPISTDRPAPPINTAFTRSEPIQSQQQLNRYPPSESAHPNPNQLSLHNSSPQPNPQSTTIMNQQDSPAPIDVVGGYIRGKHKFSRKPGPVEDGGMNSSQLQSVQDGSVQSGQTMQVSNEVKTTKFVRRTQNQSVPKIPCSICGVMYDIAIIQTHEKDCESAHEQKQMETRMREQINCPLFTWTFVNSFKQNIKCPLCSKQIQVISLKDHVKNKQCSLLKGNDLNVERKWQTKLDQIDREKLEEVERKKEEKRKKEEEKRKKEEEERLKKEEEKRQKEEEKRKKEEEERLKKEEEKRQKEEEEKGKKEEERLKKEGEKRQKEEEEKGKKEEERLKKEEEKRQKEEERLKKEEEKRKKEKEKGRKEEKEEEESEWEEEEEEEEEKPLSKQEQNDVKSEKEDKKEEETMKKEKTEEHIRQENEERKREEDELQFMKDKDDRKRPQKEAETDAPQNPPHRPPKDYIATNNPIRDRNVQSNPQRPKSAAPKQTPKQKPAWK